MRDIPFLADAKVVQLDKNTLTAIADHDGPIKLSFFGLPHLGLIEPPQVADDIGMNIASLIDLAGTKASAVQTRSEAKDYLDIDAMMSRGITLPHALAAPPVCSVACSIPRSPLKEAPSYFRRWRPAFATSRGSVSHRQGGRKDRPEPIAQTPVHSRGTMRDLSRFPELAAVARNTVWFKSPDEALAAPFHLIAHALTYGTPDDVIDTPLLRDQCRAPRGPRPCSARHLRRSLMELLESGPGTLSGPPHAAQTP